MRLKSKILLTVALALWSPLLSYQPIYAADLEMSLRTNVGLASLDRLAEITQSVTLTNRTGATVPGELAIPVFGTAIKALTVVGENSGAITADYIAQSNTITLNPAFLPQAAEVSKTFTISYSSELSEAKGASTLLLLPATPSEISGFLVTGENRTMRLDLGFGLATRVGPMEPSVSISVGQQVLTWNQEGGPIASTTGVVFGEGALAEVTITTTLKNSSLWWKTVSLPLPPETNQQRSFIQSAEPRPDNVRVDLDGNIIAEYKLAPMRSKKVTIKATILISNYNYALERASETNVLPEEFSGLDSFLKNTNRWPAANLDVTADGTPLGVIKTALAAVKAIQLDQEDPYDQALAQSDLLVGSLRSNGIPARIVLGLLEEKSGALTHAWTEVFLSGLGWITVDPSVQSGNVSTTDVRYVGLAIRGERDDFPSAKPADTTVQYIDGTQLPKAEGEPTVSSTSYMLFPGLAIRISRVNMPAGLITDLTAMEYAGDRLIHLGSLAPLQSFVSRDLMLGSAAFKKTAINFGTIADESLIKMITIESTISWVPMIVEGAVVLLAVAGWLEYRRYRRQHPPGPLHLDHKAVAGLQPMERAKVKPQKADEPALPKPPVPITKPEITAVPPPTEPIERQHPDSQTTEKPSVYQIERNVRTTPRTLQAPRKASGRPPKRLIQ